MRKWPLFLIALVLLCAMPAMASPGDGGGYQDCAVCQRDAVQPVTVAALDGVDAMDKLYGEQTFMLYEKGTEGEVVSFGSCCRQMPDGDGSPNGDGAPSTTLAADKSGGSGTLVSLIV